MCQEVSTCRYDASKDLWSSCCGDGSHGEAETEETDGGNRQKSTTSMSLFMDACGLAVEEELSTIATQYWAERVWTRTWHITNKMKRG